MAHKCAATVITLVTAIQNDKKSYIYEQVIIPLHVTLCRIESKNLQKQNNNIKVFRVIRSQDFLFGRSGRFGRLESFLVFLVVLTLSSSRSVVLTISAKSKTGNINFFVVFIFQCYFNSRLK